MKTWCFCCGGCVCALSGCVFIIFGLSLASCRTKPLFIWLRNIDIVWKWDIPGSMFLTLTVIRSIRVRSPKADWKEVPNLYDINTCQQMHSIFHEIALLVAIQAVVRPLLINCYHLKSQFQSSRKCLQHFISARTSRWSFPARAGVFPGVHSCS